MIIENFLRSIVKLGTCWRTDVDDLRLIREVVLAACRGLFPQLVLQSVARIHYGAKNRMFAPAGAVPYGTSHRWEVPNP